ncbi:MAG: DUF362 domain-containing protein [Candidatus Aminicenantes bacterium]|nr:MAG: DUF362 domain-containing protein [Candidatus Aminicenantes bacterium]
MAVSIKKVGTDVIEAVSSVMDFASYKEFIPKNSTVFLKVNLGWDLFIPGSVTNPAVFEGVVRKLQGHANDICVVESDQVLENIEKAYYKSKISEIAKRLGVHWVNLSYCKKITKNIPENLIIKNVTVPEILTKGVILTLPVMKTHNKTTITISLKNQWGCIPKMRHMYHLCLTEAISDVNAALGVNFSVVDGTIAMEGNAPKTGIPREIGIVGAGGDLVEVDSIFASLMGFNPWEIPHLVEADRRGLGKIGTSYTGDKIDAIEPFKPARHNFVSKVELLFRQSSLSSLVFKTPALFGMLVGAKIYYYLFDLLQGSSIRKEFRRHPLYGEYFDKPT